MITFAYIVYGIAVVLGLVVTLIYARYYNNNNNNNKQMYNYVTRSNPNSKQEEEMLSSAIKHFKIVNK